MTNNIYRIDLLATGGNFVSVTDDGVGIDWLVIQGSYAFATDIRLKYTNNLTTTDASGLYYTPGATNTLVVHGVIENVRGCDTADFIIGNELANLLYGDQARTGVGANDTLSGADGNDTVYGGAGIDNVNGGAGNDKLYGDAGGDSISGDSGVDTVEGGAGADTLSGGGTAGDTVAYATSGAGVQINITYGLTTTGSGGDAQGDQISSFRNVTGSALGDVLVDTVKGTIAFGYNNNGFYGGAGADRLEMGGGNDTGVGGIGNDTLLGESGRDRLSGDLGADSISGGAGIDTLTGGSGNDTITGGLGADRMAGDAGADSLTGGDGADTFIFNALSESTTGLGGRDTIVDFRHLQGDKIDLHAIDAIAGTAGVNDAFTYINSATFTPHVSGELHYRTVIGGIVVEGDTDGNGLANFAIFLQGPTSVSFGDFTL